MASVINDPGGTRRIQFIDSGGNRRAVRLGKISKRDADSFRLKLERLLSALSIGHAPDSETSSWLGSLPSDVYGKLVRVGLVPDRDYLQGETVLEFIDRYIEGRGSLKAHTIELLQQTRKDIGAYLARIGQADMPLQNFTLGHAKQFREGLLGRGLADNTVRRRCGRAKQFFQDALDHKKISENPFKSKQIPTAVTANAERQFFVSPEMVAAILDACPCNQWRLLVALARYGGLRTPSEPLLLKWEHVNWERGTLLVTSPKTAHHEGKGSRIVPLFPEVREYLEAVFDEALEGVEHVITRYRSGSENLRTQFRRIITRAGILPWEKPFQNLRASRETELVNNYPIHVVTAWLGNTQAVAMKHYLMIQDEHLQRAIGAVQGGAKSGAVQCGMASQGVDMATERA